jgi:hypothetical protein
MTDAVGIRALMLVIELWLVAGSIYCLRLGIGAIRKRRLRRGRTVLTDGDAVRGGVFWLVLAIFMIFGGVRLYVAWLQGRVVWRRQATSTSGNSD